MGLELTLASAVLLGTAAAWAAGRTPWLLGLLALAATLSSGLLFFFRDPDRDVSPEPGAFLAPADGRVLNVEQVNEPTYLRSPALKVSIFLSVLDIHVNRAPMAGEVELVRHVPGSFLRAFLPKASHANEHNLIGITDGSTRVLVKQIAGALARRVVCWLSPGERLEAGQRIGMIKFGSRVELFLPVASEVVIRPGDRVRAGATVIARRVRQLDPESVRAALQEIVHG